MPTLSQVRQWRMSALTDMAAAFGAANNDTFRAQIDGTKKMFAEDTSWKGAARDAAYDRVGEDHDQARKIGYYIEDLITAITQGASDIGSHRTVLLGKVADAQEAGLTVHDDWSVAGAPEGEVETHQDAINGAYHPFADSVATAATKISEAAELIRTSGDLFGSDLDVNDAHSQGGRLGTQDGDAAAAAAKSNDPAAWAEVASHLPTNVLTPEQIQALEHGKDVPTLPAEVQDYYKDFFQHAGKDGVLGLNNYLNGQSQAGNTMAASQQSALADGMVAITNERLGTGKTPDGKLSSPGAYTNLPPDIRTLISGRWEDLKDTRDTQAITQGFKERGQLANLLSKTDPGVVGGKTFSMESARQGESLAHTLNDLEKSHQILPSGWTMEDKKNLDTAATQFLEVGARNHEADYQLLTGKDSQTGAPIPNDLSFGANSDQYHTSGNYDSTKFSREVFEHTWTDKGKAAGSLFDWTAGETHTPGAEGDLARKTVAALPQTFAPTHTDEDTHRPSLVTESDRKTVYQHTIESFNKNPEMANALSRVTAGNLDAFAFAGDKVVDDPRPQLELGLEDSKRLLFLSSQTEEGRQTLDSARHEYDNATLYQLTHNDGHGVLSPRLAIERMANLDAHIDAAGSNAITYQVGHKVAEYNDQADQSHKNTKEISDVVKKIVDAVPVPGGPAVGAVKSVAEDQMYKSLMDSINPKPHPHLVQFENIDQVYANGKNNFENSINSWAKDSGDPLPLDSYKSVYGRVYNDEAQASYARNSSDLEQIITGGAQAPKSEKK